MLHIKDFWPRLGRCVNTDWGLGWFSVSKLTTFSNRCGTARPNCISSLRKHAKKSSAAGTHSLSRKGGRSYQIISIHWPTPRISNHSELCNGSTSNCMQWLSWCGEMVLYIVSWGIHRWHETLEKIKRISKPGIEPGSPPPEGYNTFVLHVIRRAAITPLWVIRPKLIRVYIIYGTPFLGSEPIMY